MSTPVATETVWEGTPDGPDDEPAAPRASNGHKPRPAQPALDTTPPHDNAAEKAVIGAALLQPDLIPELAGILRDDDWYLPAHRVIWDAITDLHATGQPVDLLNIGLNVGTDRTLTSLGGPLYISDLTNAIPATSSATYYARIVAARATERRTVELGTWLTQAGHNGTERAVIEERVNKHLADRNPAERAGAEIPTVDELLAQDETDEPAWIIPDLLERGDRVILTGPEGGGKSTFLRQFAIMAAAGIHPFRNTPMPPIGVVFVDLENSHRQTRRKTRPLRIQAGTRLDPERLHMEVRIQGVDLTNSADVTWLSQAVGRYKPDLLITGPVYKMANGDPNEEKSAKPVALAIDRIRAEHDVAVLLEAHSAKAPAGQKRRPREPYGWSGWMRWPEFGIHLDDDGALTHWRGQRDERDWPELLLRGGTWPWMPANTQPDKRWAQIHQCLTAAGQRLSNREISRRTDIPEKTVRTLLASNSRRLAALLEHIGSQAEDDQQETIDGP